MGKQRDHLRLWGSFLSLSCGTGIFCTACLSDLAGNSPSPGPIEGDFAVSDYFSASGFMGDGAIRGRLTMKRDEACRPRSEDAVGSCFHFTYNAGDEGWAGVFFQYPANSWGSEPGRAIADNYSRVRFEASAEYKIVPPSGAGVGDSCSAASDCRPGLGCETGACQPDGSRAESQGCLISAECGAGLQCVAQECVAEGDGAVGAECPGGSDGHCAAGLRCGENFTCRAEGNGDVGAECESRNDCFSGLYCSEGACRPRTELGPFQFKIGGIAAAPEKGFAYGDVIGPEFPGTLGPETVEFDLDIGRQFSIEYYEDPDNLPPYRFDTLIGAFMWAAAFPDVDEIRDEPVAYKASLDNPVHIYFDNIRYVSDATYQAEQGQGQGGSP